MAQKTLTASEWIVMDKLWGKEPQVLSEIIDAIGTQVEWNYQTYASYLNVLCEKGFVSFHRRGRTKFYYPLMARDECIEAESKSMRQKMSKETVERFLLCMIRDAELSENAQDELRALINELAEKE